MKHITILLISAILTSCSHKGLKVENVLNINLDEAENIDIEDYIEDVSCIVLTDNPLRDCWRIIEYGNFIYMYSLSDFAVSIHTSSGKFVRNINSSGKGSVTLPTCVYINKHKNELWILDERYYINTYTLSGDFIERKELPFAAVNVCNINNNYLFYDGGNDRNNKYYFHLSSFDNGAFNLISSHIEKSEKKISAHIPPALFTYNNSLDTVYTLPKQNSTVYFSENKNTLTPLFKLKSDKYTILDEEDFPAKGFTDKEFSDILKNGNIISIISNFYYSNRKLFFRTNNTGYPYYMLHVDNSKLYCFNELMEGLRTSTPATSIQGSNGEYLYFFFSVKEIREHYKKKSLPSKYPTINQVLNDGNDSEDVIVKIKII
ncbi:MAG: 6-bladed beta-propeller [Tannerella sp.]|jgi:hypothetical protein|nr:6-bladed beta-propeller [Tannerella sp.]